MRFAVLASPDSWYLRDLQRAAGGRFEIQGVSQSELWSTLRSLQWRAGSAAVDLRAFDAVLIRTMPPGSLEQVVFRMDVLGKLHSSGAVVLNPPRAIEVAVDKYLASERLQAAGLPTPATWVCQTIDEAMQGFAELGGDVVLKPLFGSEGRGIMRLNDPDLAWRAFKLLTQLGSVLYLQAFVAHEGFDLRLFVLGEEVYGMRRCNQHDWRTNISRGATGERLTVTQELAELARRASEAVGAPLAGVDVLPGRDGQLHVLEVNAVPGWKALARTLNLDIAARVLDLVASCVQRRRREAEHREDAEHRDKKQ